MPNDALFFDPDQPIIEALASIMNMGGMGVLAKAAVRLTAHADPQEPTSVLLTPKQLLSLAAAAEIAMCLLEDWPAKPQP